MDANEIAARIEKIENELPDRGRDDLKQQKAHTLALMEIALQLAILNANSHTTKS